MKLRWRLTTSSWGGSRCTWSCACFACVASAVRVCRVRVGRRDPVAIYVLMANPSDPQRRQSHGEGRRATRYEEGDGRQREIGASPLGARKIRPAREGGEKREKLVCTFRVLLDCWSLVRCIYCERTRSLSALAPRERASRLRQWCGCRSVCLFCPTLPPGGDHAVPGRVRASRAWRLRCVCVASESDGETPLQFMC